ncbi:MAG: hypothetical protein IT453_03055 [Planctomycetes bacterium]|nr:hypothetical protein [Planctomycetota bacterium]
MTQNEPNDARLLFDPRVERTLSELAHELAPLDPLKRVERLRRALSGPLATVAASLYDLRRRATRKFDEPDRAFLTRKGLEQATPLPVAHDRAKQVLELAGACELHDLTCGLGADALALSRAGARVLASDLDEMTVRCAARNLADPRRNALVSRADALRPCSRVPYRLLDPDRRAHGERTRAAERMSPTFADAIALARSARGACLKLPPAFELGGRELAVLGDLPWRASWSSLDGELMELTLWTGEWAADDVGRREARRLTFAAHTPVRIRRSDRIGSAVPEIEPWSDAEVAAQEVLVEPDVALVRAGLIEELAEELDLRPVGPDIAYLAGRRPEPSPWFDAWRIVDSASADERRVREMLARHDIGPVQVRKRGHPDTGEVLARRFAGRGRRRGHLAVARTAGGHRVFLLESLPTGPGAGGRLVGDEGFEPPTSSL